MDTDPTDKIIAIMKEANDLMLEAHQTQSYVKLEEIFDNVDYSKPFIEWLSLLRMTSPLRFKSLKWDEFRRKAIEEFKARYPDKSVDEIFTGLQPAEDYKFVSVYDQWLALVASRK